MEMIIYGFDTGNHAHNNGWYSANSPGVLDLNMEQK